MFRIIFDSLKTNYSISDEEIVIKLQSEPKLKDIKTPIPASEKEPITKKFSRSVVRAKVVEDTLKSRAPCTVCGARLSPSFRSKDHKTKEADGGMGNIEKKFKFYSSVL